MRAQYTQQHQHCAQAGGWAGRWSIQTCKTRPWRSRRASALPCTCAMRRLPRRCMTVQLWQLKVHCNDSRFEVHREEVGHVGCAVQRDRVDHSIKGLRDRQNAAQRNEAQGSPRHVGTALCGVVCEINSKLVAICPTVRLCMPLSSRSASLLMQWIP